MCTKQVAETAQRCRICRIIHDSWMIVPVACVQSPVTNGLAQMSDRLQSLRGNSFMCIMCRWTVTWRYSLFVESAHCVDHCPKKNIPVGYIVFSRLPNVSTDRAGPVIVAQHRADGRLGPDNAKFRCPIVGCVTVVVTSVFGRWTFPVLRSTWQTFYQS